jgi:hypothetical protein
MAKARVDEDIWIFQNEVIKLLAENNAIMKSHYMILQSLNENVRKIMINTN